MPRLKPTTRLWTGVLALLMTSGALAQVDLRWSPPDSIIAPGDQLRLGVHLDQGLNLRTIEVTVTYDTTIVSSLDGGPGALFADSGYFIFQGFEEEPGQWHGFAIVMGAGEYVSGPGELFYWEVEGLVSGVSPITTVEVRLYDELSPPNLYPDVSLDNGSIIVQDPFSAVPDTPEAGLGISVFPNPFNPRVQVSFTLDEAADTRLTVHDARGRQVAVLHHGQAEAGPQTFQWSGRDGAGRLMPAGVYVFELQSGGRTQRAKAVLVK